jgi:hypothetical protein
MRERDGLSAGGRWIRTLGPPSGQHFCKGRPQNPATTNQPGSQNQILTIDKGRFPRPASKARSGRASRRHPTIGGIMNLLNNMMGVAAPITTGYIVGATQSFTGCLPAAGIVLVIGIVA